MSGANEDKVQETLQYLKGAARALEYGGNDQFTPSGRKLIIMKEEIDQMRRELVEIQLEEGWY